MKSNTFERRQYAKFKRILLVAAILLAGSIVPKTLLAGTIESIKEQGVLVAGVEDATLPFGFIDTKTGKIVGAEADLAEAIAKKLGVRLQLTPVSSSNRIPRLIDGEVDAVTADGAILLEMLAMSEARNDYQIPDIQISETEGTFICKGKVKRIHADEIYVDVEEEMTKLTMQHRNQYDYGYYRNGWYW